MSAADTAPFELGEAKGQPCLLIHGFTGNPWEMRPLGEALAGAGYFVRGIRLPGHGLSPESLLGVTWEDWTHAAEEGLTSFGRGPVRLAGLSMGALLSVWLAARHPDEVGALALLAPAVRFRSPSLKVARALERVHLLERIKPWVEKETTDLLDPGARAESPLLPAFPSARLKDLWKTQELAREAWGQVRAPTLILTARHDHVVDASGARELARGIRRAPVRFVEVQEGAHIMPRDLGRATVAAEVVDFFRRF